MNTPIKSSDPIAGRVVALAALMQSLQQVRNLADNGRYDESDARPVVHSVLRIDAPDALSIYGNRHALSAGMSVLRSYLQRDASDDAVAKMAMSVMQTERSLARDESVQGRMRSGIERLDSAEQLGDLMNQVGQLYADTVSKVRPSVIVSGNPQYLERPEIVTEIRALLMAAVRAAVLWRQMGGTAIDLIFRRTTMLRAMESL